MFAQAGHAEAVSGAGPDDGGEDGGEQGVGDGVHAADVLVAAEGAGLVEQGQSDEDGDGEGAADPGGGDGAGHGFAGDLPDDGAEHAAAVEGEAGQEVEDGDDQVGDHQAGEEDAGDGAGLYGFEGEVEESGEDEGEQGSDEGEDEFAARCLGFLLDLGDAAEELELDAADGEFEAERGDGVGEFVDEYGGVEGDREEEGDEVAQGAEFGQDAVELAAEDPGDEGGDEEPARGDVHRYAEGAAHEDAAAGFLGALGGRVGAGDAGVGEGAVFVLGPVLGVAGSGLVGGGPVGVRAVFGVVFRVRGRRHWGVLGRVVLVRPRLPVPAAHVHGVPLFEASSARDRAEGSRVDGMRPGWRGPLRHPGVLGAGVWGWVAVGAGPYGLGSWRAVVRTGPLRAFGVARAARRVSRGSSWRLRRCLRRGRVISCGARCCTGSG